MPGGPVRNVVINRSPFHIGKATDNDLQLSDRTVSSHHAAVTWSEARYVINDAGSSYGLFVNGEKVGPQGRILAHGSVITLGNVRLTFEIANAGEPPRPRAESEDLAPPAPESRICGHIDVIPPSGDVTRIPLAAPRMTIGFHEENDISIDDRSVSSRHAALKLQDNEWHIEDLKSRNGTYLNNERVGPHGARINSGDTIEIGQTKLTINISTAPQLRTVVDAPLAAPPPPSVPVAPPIRVAPPIQAAPPKDAAQDQPQPVHQGKAREAGSILEGRYKLEKLISDSFNGTVYLATRVMLGDKVVVKLLRSELVRNPLAIARFEREAQVAARIHHPNSVQVFDFGATADGEVYIVEELTSGKTLRDLLEQERGLSLQRVIRIFNQICGAAHTAHLNGIILRNITPDSIFIDTDQDGKEIVKLGGYSLARIESQSADTMTIAGQAKLLGSPQYMSPEQWLDKPLDSRADVYSLGVILFELLTGEVPFNSSKPIEIAQMHLSAPPPDITRYNRPDIDEGIAAVANRALAKDPAYRQATALQLASELRAVSGAGTGLLNLVRGKPPAAPSAEQVVVAAGEDALPSAVAKVEPKGRGGLNPVVLALMAEAFMSRLSSGLIKTAVPLYALLVFGMSIPSVMALVLIQNIVPLLLRPLFGSLADKYGKKRIFLFALFIRTGVSALYVIATLPLLFVISSIRGIADSAKGPSASAMIADSTDERSIAQAYSWYTTVKSTSGGVGEAVAAFLLVIFLVMLAGSQMVTANVAVLNEMDRSGKPKEQIVDTATVESGTLQPNVAVVEQRQIKLSQVPLDDLPKVVDRGLLRKALTIIFILAAFFSAASVLLVLIFIKERRPPKSKDKKKARSAGLSAQPQKAQPNIWSFALLGAMLTAPAYMVTGEFFTVLAVKLEVTPTTLGWIKVVAETIVPLIFGPTFGWLADRIGVGKVIAMRSVSNIITSVLFWITPWFAGTALLGLMMGLARGIDELGKAAFKPTWGAVAAKVSSFNPANRSRSMGIMEGGVDASDLTFPVLAGLLLQYTSLGALMIVRAALAVLSEIYLIVLTKKYQLLGKRQSKMPAPQEAVKAVSGS